MFESTGPEAAQAGGALRAVLDPLSDGRLPFMALSATPQDAVMRPARSCGGDAIRPGEVAPELARQVARHLGQRRRLGRARSSPVGSAVSCARGTSGLLLDPVDHGRDPFLGAGGAAPPAPSAT